MPTIGFELQTSGYIPFSGIGCQIPGFSTVENLSAQARCRGYRPRGAGVPRTFQKSGFSAGKSLHKQGAGARCQDGQEGPGLLTTEVRVIFAEIRSTCRMQGISWRRNERHQCLCPVKVPHWIHHEMYASVVVSQAIGGRITR